MPAYAQSNRITRPRERLIALSAVAAVQLSLALALLIGLRVTIAPSRDVVERLVQVTLPAPPPVPPEPKIDPAPKRQPVSAPRAAPAPIGGSRGPEPAHAPPSIAPVVSILPTVAPSGGGSGSGPASGAGAGGGTGGNGSGAGSGGGGTELEQIAGDIMPRDYPRHLARAGIGGTVGMRGTVGINGRVTNCAVVRSSGVPELDGLTCRLIEQRFVYRPATDRAGRPVADRIEIDWTWD